MRGEGDGWMQQYGLQRVNIDGLRDGNASRVEVSIFDLTTSLQVGSSAPQPQSSASSGSGRRRRSKPLPTPALDHTDDQVAAAATTPGPEHPLRFFVKLESADRIMAIIVPVASTVAHVKTTALERMLPSAAHEPDEWTLSLDLAELLESDRVSDACLPTEVLVLRKKASLDDSALPDAKGILSDPATHGCSELWRPANGIEPSVSGGEGKRGWHDLKSESSERSNDYDGGCTWCDRTTPTGDSQHTVGAQHMAVPRFVDVTPARRRDDERRGSVGPLPFGRCSSNSLSSERIRCSHIQHSSAAHRAPNHVFHVDTLTAVRQLEDDAALEERIWREFVDSEWEHMTCDQQSACPQLRMFARYSLVRPFDLVVPFVFSGRCQPHTPLSKMCVEARKQPLFCRPCCVPPLPCRIGGWTRSWQLQCMTKTQRSVGMSSRRS
jgi:hypothetical protein